MYPSEAYELELRVVNADKPILIDDIDSPYASNESLKKIIYERGI